MNPEKPWWELYGALFGATLTPERCQAWSEIWGAKGYTNRDMTAAVLSMAKLPPSDRPNWPNEHIDTIEKIMFRQALAGILAGRCPAEKAALLLNDLKAHREAARKASAKAGGEYPDQERPETKEYRDAQQALNHATVLVKLASQLEIKNQTPLPRLRGV